MILAAGTFFNAISTTSLFLGLGAVMAYATPALVGARLSYVDLSLFQLVEGLLYAFPKATKRALKKTPLVLALRERVSQQRRVAAYLCSERRIPFNEDGIFRRYPELDA